MADREKLVRLIDEVAEGMLIQRCGELVCTVNSDDIADYLISHGVTVKEPQKPLTVEEVMKLPEVVWVEWKIGMEIEPKIPSTLTRNNQGNSLFIDFTDEIYENMSEYGKLWRCWAEKPTEEERKAAEWK